MRKIEFFIIGCILGVGPLLFCLIAFFVAGDMSGFLTDNTGPWLMLAAFITGIVIDVIFLKRWIQNIYRCNIKIPAAIHIFYSLVALGMGMGVPILNFAVGVLSGVYIARRLHYSHAEQDVCKASIRKTAFFSGKVMMAMCCLTGIWALIGGMVGERFESPIVSFTFTAPILIAIVLSGGLFLSVAQYRLTHATAKLVIKMRK